MGHPDLTVYTSRKTLRAAKILEAEVVGNGDGTTDGTVRITLDLPSRPIFNSRPRWIGWYRPRDGDLGYYVFNEADDYSYWLSTKDFEDNYKLAIPQP